MTDTRELVERLFEAQVGGCECLTKTPDIEYHDRLCKFRLCVESLSTIESLQSRLAAAEKDAWRYRWLRSQPMLNGFALVSLKIMDINEDGPTGVFYSHDGADLDTAIDAARKQP